MGMALAGRVRDRLWPFCAVTLLLQLVACGGNGTTANSGSSGTTSGAGGATQTPVTTTPPSTGTTSPPGNTTPPPTSTTPPSTGTTPPSTGTTPPPTITTQSTGYWHTNGSQILDSNNQPVRIAGVNWYGFETPDHLAHGLWAQDYHSILSTIKSLGFNLVRIPFSNEMVERNPVPTNFTTNAGGKAANTELMGKSALEDLDTLVSYAGSIGLRVILDNHRSEAGNSNEASGLWYTAAYPQSAWLADWQMLASRYSDPRFTFNGNATVVGMDLRNEPHLSGGSATSGSCWTGDTAVSGCPRSLTAQNWPVAAEAAGNAILTVNPNLLIFVEGIDCYDGVCGWQGGNLMGVASNPVMLNVANHLVYSAHDYGPALFRQAWFNGNTSPASLNEVWSKYWGYISTAGTAPVWLGEFGTTNTAADIQSTAAGSQGQWFTSLVAYV